MNMMRYFLIALAGFICVIGALVIARHSRTSNHCVIAFAGDVMLGRMVNEIVGQNGYKYPWGDMLSVLRSTDLNIINLETTLTYATQKTPKVFNFKAFPDRVQVLQEARIDVVNLANNHALDFGSDGLRETLAILDRAGIAHVGAGSNAARASAPVVIEKKGFKIGILGCTDNEPGWRAGTNHPGVCYFNVHDTKALCSAITELKERVDCVVVSLHWGPNMRTRPTSEYIACAHRLVDCGADIIHGHSAHVLQGVEIYRNKLIMYDTGDFVDDYAVDQYLHNDYSCLFLVTLCADGLKSVQLVPVVIKSMQVNRAGKEDKKHILRMMQKASQEFGTKIDEKGEVVIS